MYIKKFIIERYRAITRPIEFNFEKQSLFPIIGVNECGKTSILNALFAFDSYNDTSNDTIKHLDDVWNLYDTVVEPAIIKAEVVCTKDEIIGILEYLQQREGEFETEEDLEELRKSRFWFNKEIPTSFIITRKIYKKDNSLYEIDLGELTDFLIDKSDFIDEVIKELPYILYFDDFRDSFPDKIYLDKKDLSNSDTWLSIIEELFKKTDKNYTVSELQKHDKRLRNNIISDVERKLNETLTKEWANFKLDNKENLNVKISYEVDDDSNSNSSLSYLSFDIEETGKNGVKRNFSIKDRSKGFYWFFNFVMKLEFNPKNWGSKGQNAIYLLDEPGSYLHAFAQQKLCNKLKSIAEDNKVIYCTHSHHLLNPEVIPINNVFVAQKPNFGNIEINRVIDVPLKEKNKTPLAFQTYYDALYIKPDLINFNYDEILIVEGIYDYYSYFIFANLFEKKIGVMPCRGADSINILISICLGFELNFTALWDNDGKGIEKKCEAEEYFGTEFSDRLKLLPLKGQKKKRRLEDLFEKNDLEMIKSELLFSKNTPFEKVIAGLFYSNYRNQIVEKISVETKSNFREVFELV